LSYGRSGRGGDRRITIPARSGRAKLSLPPGSAGARGAGWP